MFKFITYFLVKKINNAGKSYKVILHYLANNPDNKKNVFV